MMVKASKHKKCDGVKKKFVCTREDRISGLPEAILCHILSYLPTKEAVRASVLSKRWTYAWTSVPCIEIDDSSLLSDQARCGFSEVKNWIMDFADRVLHRNDVSCLRKLYLRFDRFHHLSRVRELINTVIMRDVEELDVTFLKGQYNQFLRERIELPPRLFTSKKLVILKLKDWCNLLLKFPAAVYLPCLKVLHLHLLQFFGDDSMKNLLDGCPIIEELDIENAQYDTVETLLVQSSSLRSLRLGTQNFCCKQGVITCVIDATNLEQLDITDDVTVVYEMVNLPSLIKVKLDLCESCPKVLGLDFCCDKSLGLLRKVSNNTKHLFLSSHFMECHEYADWDDVSDVPRFQSLNHLELKTFRYNWSFMSVLLECSPNLKTFVVHKERPRETKSQQQFQAPKCFMLNLEEVELKGFKGSTDDMELVRYFLKNATVLKKMSIHSYFSSPKKHAEISKKLLAFVRVSTECQIIFG